MKKYHLKPSVQTLTILLLVLLLLTGCSSGDEKGYEMSNASNYREAGYQSTVSQEADYDGGYYETEMLYEEVSGDEASRAEEGPDQTQKLVYKASLEIETLAYKDTMNAIYQLIEEKNGFVASESTSDSNYSWYRSYDSGESMMTTTMTIRIPSEQYQSFLKGIDGSGGRVTRRSQSVENITRKYNDQSVLVKALETQEMRLQEMMDKAETIDEMIAVESRLTEVQTQLNQEKSYLDTLEKDVAYSTVTLEIREVKDYTVIKEEPKSFPERVWEAVGSTVSGFGNFLQDLVIFLIEICPYLIFLILVIWVLRKLLRRRKRRRNNCDQGAGGSDCRREKGNFRLRFGKRKKETEQEKNQPEKTE